MQASLPLARCINGISQPTTSRIPHLTFHIVRRQNLLSAPCEPRLPSPNALLQRRFQHSSSITFGDAAFLSFIPPATSDEHDGNRHAASHGNDGISAARGKLRASEARGKVVSLEDLLEENNPDRILLGLVTSSIGDNFIATADDATFSRAICALDPDYFIVPYRTLFRYLKPSLESEPRFRMVKSLEERVNTFINILDTLVTRREEQGYTISVDVYRHLLRCAAAAGIGSFARNVFSKAMPENNITPDLDCYNYFMEALNWNEAFNRHERYRLRIIRHNIFRRSLSARPVGFYGHGVATATNRQNEDSIRLEILGIFNDLVRQGLNGNEATFCNLMVAMGREGDLASVKSVLKSVWNIDVDALDKYDEEELESPTFYDDGSPLRPSGRLLSTVVHIFGTNNEVAVAGMLLDYISRNYNLDIPEVVWTNLLEWTFVLSIQHASWRLQRGYGEGRIARKAVESVYKVFHSEPYNVKPSIVDLMFRVKSRMAARNLDRTIDDLRECMGILDAERTELSALYDRMRSYLRQEHDGIFKDGVASKEFLQLKREYILASLKLDCHIQLISIAVRNTFKKDNWPSQDFRRDWPYRRLPQFVQEWADWLPNVLPYYTPTGHVRMWGLEHRKDAIISANSAQTTKAGSMRFMFDTYSPARLRHSADYVHRGPRGLATFEEESTSDETGTLSDWVFKYEQEMRADRLRDRPVGGKPAVPSAEYQYEDWIPWMRIAKAEKSTDNKIDSID